jgi:hypothetical protein
MPVGQAPVGQMAVGQMPVGKMAVGQMFSGQKAWNPLYLPTKFGVHQDFFLSTKDKC